MNYPHKVPTSRLSCNQEEKKEESTLTCISLPQHTDIQQFTLEYNIQQHALLFSLCRF